MDNRGPAIIHIWAACRIPFRKNCRRPHNRHVLSHASPEAQVCLVSIAYFLSFAFRASMTAFMMATSSLKPTTFLSILFQLAARSESCALILACCQSVAFSCTLTFASDAPHLFCATTKPLTYHFLPQWVNGKLN